MEAQLEKIKEVQKAAWNKTSSGWKKWDSMMMKFLQPMSDQMITMLKLKDDDNVLDVATGTGEPGLTIAATVKHGKVTGTDLSENMLSIANENAAYRNITNFETVCCDASEMPFEDESFDAISCRLSFMFFPDMALALKEMMRVLKPGGRICSSVWCGPGKNSWISNSMDVMIRTLKLNPPAPGGPGLYRCAEPGIMSSLFTNCGLMHTEQAVVHGTLSCNSLEDYWNFITDVASPVAFSNAHEKTRQEIREEVMSRVKSECPDGKINLASTALLTCGQKP